MKKHYNKKMVEENCHPFRAFLVGFVQIPAWVFVSLGLRNLCGYSYSGVLNTILFDKVCRDLRQVGGFLRALRFRPPIKLTAMI
jgi:hypothetical protein